MNKKTKCKSLKAIGRAWRALSNVERARYRSLERNGWLNYVILNRKSEK